MFFTKKTSYEHINTTRQSTTDTEVIYDRLDVLLGVITHFRSTRQHKNNKRPHTLISSNFTDNTCHVDKNTTKRIKPSKHAIFDHMSVLCAAGGHLRSVANELCSKNKQKKRTPTKEEISKGVLPHLLVQEVSRKHSNRVDKYYWTQNGHKYRSISQLKRDTVFLNVYKDNISYGRVGRLISETSAEIVNDISPSATLFYQGVGRASNEKLGNFLGKTQDICLSLGRENIFPLNL